MTQHQNKTAQLGNMLVPQLIWLFGNKNTFNYGCRYMSFHTKFFFPEVSSYACILCRIQFTCITWMKCDRLFAQHAEGTEGQGGGRRIYFDIVKFQNYSDQKWLACDMDRAKIPQQTV
jgi:hypothetical protein